MTGGAFNLSLHLVADRPLEAELTGGDRHWDHDLRMRVEAFLLKLGGGGEYRPVLSFGDERVGHVQTHSTVTHHRVDLMKGLATLLDVLDSDTQLLGKLLLLLLCLRHEFVERRVKQTEHNRLAVHDLQGALHRCLDVRLKLSESGLSFLVSVAEDHLAQFSQRLLGVEPVEHVLDTEQSDSLGSETEGLLSVLRGGGVGSDTNLAELVDD